MATFSDGTNSVAFLLSKDHRNLIYYSLNHSWMNEHALQKAILEDIALIEPLRKKLKEAYRWGNKPSVIHFNKHELLLIKNAILLVSSVVKKYDFPYKFFCSLENSQQLLIRLNSLLASWEGFEEEKAQASYYPLSIDQQVTLGKHYVYAFFERSPTNLDFITDLLNRERLLKIFYLFKSKEAAGKQYPLTLRSYEMLLERCEAEKQEVFVLHFLPYKKQCYYNGVELYIYPEAIVVAIYKQPWDVFDPTLIELSHSLFEKAHRVMTGFKKMDSIQSIQPEPSLNELIKNGQILPTLERQSPNADFEIKNFNQEDEKHSNALKMLQFCVQDYLTFM